MTVLIIFLAAILFLALTRVPFGFAMAGATVIGYLYAGISLDGLPQTVVLGLDSFGLLAIPCFILAGNLMSKGGISAALVDFVKIFLSRFRGSLGAITSITSMIFGAISGSSVATVAAIGGIMTPEMEKDGYSKPYITALIASSGFLGTLIPPSVPGLTYALMAEQKVTQVWMSTLASGLLLGLTYCVINYIVYGRKQEKVRVQISSDMIKKSTPRALVAFIMPLIIFGGVYGGICTATEAGGLAVFYGLLAGWIIYPLLFKEKAPKLTHTLKDSMVSATNIGILLAFATGTGHLISLARVPDHIVEFMTSVTDSKIVFLLIMNIVLLIAGMIMECNVNVILFTPIFLPLAQAYGVDPIHFGAIMLLNLEIGFITPPHAGNIFVGCRVTGCTMDQVLKPLAPFYIAAIAVLMLVTYVPAFPMLFVS